MTEVTRHGRRRLKKRAGLKRKSTTRMAQKALHQGLKPRDATGKLRRYLDCKQLRQGCDVRVHGDMVYIFSNATLITSYTLPSNLKAMAIKALNRKKEGEI